MLRSPPVPVGSSRFRRRLHPGIFYAFSPLGLTNGEPILRLMAMFVFSGSKRIATRRLRVLQKKSGNKTCDDCIQKNTQDASVSYGECKDLHVAKKRVNGGSGINRQQPLNGSLSDNRRNQAAIDCRAGNYHDGELGGVRVKSRSIKDKLMRFHLKASSTNRIHHHLIMRQWLSMMESMSYPKRGVVMKSPVKLQETTTTVHRNSRMEGDSRKNYCEVEGVIDEEKLQVLSKCLVGWFKDFIKIGHLARQMQTKGLTGFSLMRVAGNAVLMIFEDSTSLRSVKNDKSETLAKWFSRVEAWSESLVVGFRRGEALSKTLQISRCNSFKIIVHEIEPSFKPNSWAPDEDESY
ncbi:hypothetical protein F3Y22_tig00111616pilonHSYRG00018 [Hibiscus syriacus]|uniref:Uncharacterized protein n=1 Tax=Hibiscus syriacus TaxID=106335 RepID=A0A6A2YIJ3_HIBSY|nr:hypothetical protein F3Y22_tig00111616pilonHSYRG00018 [Hibiscus syriacus]